MGVVFSIVVVSVQLASGQFSPRIVRNFFADWRSQFTVGMLAATFTYSALALFSVSSSATVKSGVPLVAVGLSAIFGLVSILSIVSFLNHSTRRLYVGNLAGRVMRETLKLLEHLARQGPGAGEEEEQLAAPVPDGALTVRSDRDGWLQQVSVDALLGVLEGSRTIRLESRVGAYVVAGSPLVRVWPPPRDEEGFARQSLDAFVLGQERTMQQDLDFGFRQLSDIALRALSPAINDPHTAIEIVLRHGSLLRRILVGRLPARVAHRGGVTVLRPHDLRFEDYVEHAFGDIRVAAAGQPSVARAVVTTCRTLARTAEEIGRPDQAEAPLRQLRLMLAGAERGGVLPEDLVTLHEAAGPGPG